MNTYAEQYQKKRMTAAQALELIQDRDYLFSAQAAAEPREILSNLQHLKETGVKGVTLNTCLPIRYYEAMKDPEMAGIMDHSGWFFNAGLRDAQKKKLVSAVPQSSTSVLRKTLSRIRYEGRRPVVMATASPMDEHGYLSLSVSAIYERDLINEGALVLLEVNPNFPRTFGDTQVHISEVDAIVEGEHPDLFEIPSASGSEIDELIANQIVSQMEDGACVQLGVGGMPDLIGKKIAESDLKNLGVHSELIVNANLDMYKAGKITNSNKSGEMKGKTVGGLVYGTKELVEWTAENPDVMICPMDYVNDVNIIRSLDKFTSINSCVGVDLFGQISSESAGTRHISGTGGQLDFLTGAYDNPTGKSFICMPSSRVDRKGVRHSNVHATFHGDIITDPRSQSYQLVTEYGMVNLAGRSTWERAEMLISVAHPDFREELIQSAEEMKIWRRSNKLK